MYVPLLNDSAALHLTLADWESLGFSHVAIDALNWMIRLGNSFETIDSVISLPVAIAENATTIFLSNAVRFCHKTSGQKNNKPYFSLYSPYDGQKIKVTLEKQGILFEYLKKKFPTKNVIFSNTEYLSTYNITEKPAQDGEQGVVYQKEATIHIQDSLWEDICEPIDSQCSCYTCRHFTLAYLHHLHKAGVLLGIRLVILHNVAMAKNRFLTI